MNAEEEKNGNILRLKWAVEYKSVWDAALCAHFAVWIHSKISLSRQMDKLEV